MAFKRKTISFTASDCLLANVEFYSTMKNAIVLAASAMLLSSTAFAQVSNQKVNDVIEPLPAGSVKFNGYFADDIRNSIDHWVNGVMPYDKVIDFFITGRSQFALGEMPGKCIRTNSLLYRYNQNPELKKLTKDLVYKLMATEKSNGSISCTAVEDQPGGRDGDIWERKYVMLGLLQYYTDVEQDPRVLSALEKEAKSVIDQVGPAPKKSITELGWSSTKIESSSILEPMMRLYFITGKKDYLDFAEYIVRTGASKGSNIFQQVLEGTPVHEVGKPYPKAYEMTSIWEGLAEYYRATGDPRWKACLDNFFNDVKDNEITIIGNAGSDIYWPRLNGEGWSNTAVEQTNPDIKRMMETCVGVTWMKYCSQYLRLTGDPTAVDYISKYAYNGLLGAMKPDGRSFSYVNLLNGAKVTDRGWGTNIDGRAVTCCNLSGPCGLSYLPYIAAMQSKEGPVINLYNAGTVSAKTAAGNDVRLEIVTEYPRANEVKISVNPDSKEKFTVKLHIPSWSENTYVAVNGKYVGEIKAGKYLDLERGWKPGDSIYIIFDMRAKLIKASENGRNPEGKYFQAVQWGPLVLARDENIDPDYNKPVKIVADDNGEVKVRIVDAERPGTRMQFLVPTTEGEIKMVDYSSVDCWKGKHIQTWLPTIR